MKKHFYSHLIDLEPLFIELDTLDFGEQERSELAELIDSHIHTSILDTLFSELNEKEKLSFINLLGENDHSKIWEHLFKNIEKVEEKILKVVNELISELQEDIRQASLLRKAKN